MEPIEGVERGNLLTRLCFKVGERMFGRVPTPARLMARRLPMMVALGGLHGAIERCGTIDRRLRSLMNFQVATLYGVPY
jgi:hypothetical protein